MAVVWQLLAAGKDGNNSKKLGLKCPAYPPSVVRWEEIHLFPSFAL